ncbi:aldehyde oxidase-2 [Elysia marginata]|uniref:Aldehyde oxidase-2 n=1 Tax=Elysia marginata TaxID=1093978 RepID=A0AAV4JNL1_9GAST|nr:aldehyde oxidase-2 [Elysia marginata]
MFALSEADKLSESNGIEKIRENKLLKNQPLTCPSNMRTVDVKDGVVFDHSVSDKFLPTTTLNDYIREVAGLTGTKVMCKEGGCGCCAVTVTHALDGETVETMSINSVRSWLVLRFHLL